MNINQERNRRIDSLTCLWSLILTRLCCLFCMVIIQTTLNFRKKLKVSGQEMVIGLRYYWPMTT